MGVDSLGIRRMRMDFRLTNQHGTGVIFFRFHEWGGLFVTERVRDCVLQNGFSGVSFVQVENLRWPEGVDKP